MLLITLDEKISEKDNVYNEGNGFFNIPLMYSSIRRNLNRMNLLRINHRLYDVLISRVKKFAPDVIHLNNLNKEPFTVYSVIKDFKSFQTLRDYSAICPLGTCIKPDGSICCGYQYNNCNKVCGSSLARKLRFSLWKDINAYRKESIKKYISPSKKLSEFCIQNGYNTTCINNSFDFEKYKQFEKNTDFEMKKFLYYGAINTKKGIMELLDAFEEFQKDKEVELLIAGKIYDDVKDLFEKKVTECEKIRYIGSLEYSEMMYTLRDVHTIIVPSVWMENYPNTVLEGLALKILVIGSDRGGIPEMLSDNRGYTFDVTNKIDMIDKFNRAYMLTPTEYKDITDSNQKYTVNNNSLDKYYSRLIAYVEEFIL